MLVGTGIDALHGIQPSVGMGIKRLKEMVGDRVAFFGTIEAAKASSTARRGMSSVMLNTA